MHRKSKGLAMGIDRRRVLGSRRRGRVTGCCQQRLDHLVAQDQQLPGEPSPSPADGDTISSTVSQSPGCGTGAPTGEESDAPSAQVTEQSGALVENKGAESENKPETELGPIE